MVIKSSLFRDGDRREKERGVERKMERERERGHKNEIGEEKKIKRERGEESWR